MESFEETRTRNRTSPARWALRAVLLVVTLVIALYAACVVATPFVSGETTYKEVINAPVADTWTYASASKNATEWSVFFHHITPLTGPGHAPDGTVGATRVCFRNADEKGIQWSEDTKQIEPGKHRRIRTYDVKGFPGGVFSTLSEFDVNQYYRDEGDGKSSLRFTTKVHRRRGMVGLMLYPIQKVIFSAGPYDDHTQWVFKVNLENIKSAIESHRAGKPYHRVHEYEKQLWFESNPWGSPPSGRA
ncbi:MAG: hypothetical protein H7123_01115 [Thermoleophilia bacterium]|nr:hypothetical protein [Thermoleophilia bacterium]